MINIHLSIDGCFAKNNWFIRVGSETNVRLLHAVNLLQAFFCIIIVKGLSIEETGRLFSGKSIIVRSLVLLSATGFHKLCRALHLHVLNANAGAPGGKEFTDFRRLVYVCNIRNIPAVVLYFSCKKPARFFSSNTVHRYFVRLLSVNPIRGTEDRC